MRDFLIEEEVSPLSFVGSASIHDSPIDVGYDILNKLHLHPEEQRNCRTRGEAMRLWVEKAEYAGVFIFRQGQIALEEVRGFVICDEYAPFLYINSEDALAAQLFTLAHELAHLWLNQSGISNLEPFERSHQVEAFKIELFCNKVAAEAILDRDSFYYELHGQDRSLPLEEQIENLSNLFKVSEEVIARRLLDDHLISQDLYIKLRDKYQARWKEFKLMERQRLKEAGGGPSYYSRRVFNNGYSFTRAVASAFESGALSGREASGLLNVKVNHIRRLASAAGFPF
jgi:Zn-dependent peptidase ImmA (M78 family)